MPESSESLATSTDTLDLTVHRDKSSEFRTMTGEPAVEASIILIAHPEHQRMGTRYRLVPGEMLEVGRSSKAGVSLPEVAALSRVHARLQHRGEWVTLEDLGSTNGTYINGRRLHEPTALHSGDRFQVSSVHFKFLHEKDVEAAYHEAIYNLVAHDGLTEAYTKRKYEEEAARELARAARHRRPLSLILLDLDHFKDTNDTHGHLAGDALLKHFAVVVRRHLRPEQIFARVGGDEFVVLSPEMTAAQAERLAERLCHKLAASPLEYEDVRLTISVSCGVAEYAMDMERPEDLYAAADRALYKAKLAGRGRAVRAETNSGAMPPLPGSDRRFESHGFEAGSGNDAEESSTDVGEAKEDAAQDAAGRDPQADTRG